MYNEPTGQTMDGTPWAEPRPPHLPDRLTSITPWVLPFLVVLAYQGWLVWVDQPRAADAATSVDYWISAARSNLTGVAASLLGVALFVRHPDARSSLPQISTGAILLLLQQVMTLLKPAIEPWLLSLAPPGDDLALFSPVVEAYDIVTALVWVFGLAFLASGLSAARRYEDVVKGRWLVVGLTILVVASIGFYVVGLRAFDLDANPMMVTVASSLLVTLFGTLAVAYLVVVSLTGWLGQEVPRAGWGLAAVGAGMILVQRLMAPVVLVFPLSQEVLIGMFGLLADLALLGWVLMVVAFGAGLPSTEAVPDADHDLQERATADPPAATRSDSGAG